MCSPRSLCQGFPHRQLGISLNDAVSLPIELEGVWTGPSLTDLQTNDPIVGPTLANGADLRSNLVQGEHCRDRLPVVPGIDFEP